MDTYKTFKVNEDKALAIIHSITPAIIFVNGPPKIGKTTFAKKLAKDGFSVYTIKPGKEGLIAAQKYLKTARSNASNPIVLEGWLEDVKEIHTLFGEVSIYSYVFMYPNSPKNYWQRATGGDAKKTNEIKTALEKYKKIYQEHLEEFDEKILTVLV